MVEIEMWLWWQLRGVRCWFERDRLVSTHVVARDATSHAWDLHWNVVWQIRTKFWRFYLLRLLSTVVCVEVTLCLNYVLVCQCLQGWLHHVVQFALAACVWVELSLVKRLLIGIHLLVIPWDLLKASLAGWDVINQIQRILHQVLSNKSAWRIRHQSRMLNNIDLAVCLLEHLAMHLHQLVAAVLVYWCEELRWTHVFVAHYLHWRRGSLTHTFKRWGASSTYWSFIPNLRSDQLACRSLSIYLLSWQLLERSKENLLRALKW